MGPEMAHHIDSQILYKYGTLRERLGPLGLAIS